jgi:hypothetical protein
MSVVTFQIAKPWQVRLPILIRYLEKKWIDRFFECGELMLSSFSQFRKHSDEQRHDPHEGASVLDIRFGEQPLSGIAFFGSDAYVLCGSMIESLDLMAQFPGCDDYFCITDTIGFASAVANSIPGFIGGFQGACIYRDERIVQRKIDGPPLFVPPDANQSFDPEKSLHEMNRRVFEAAALEPFFFKPVSYAHQGEYRLIWTVSGMALRGFMWSRTRKCIILGRIVF